MIESGVPDKLHSYKIYGLTVVSELLLPDVPEQVTSSGERGAVGAGGVRTVAGLADVVVSLGSVRDIRGDPECITIAKDKWYILIPGPQKFFMYCEGCGFEVTDGREIKVDLPEPAKPAGRAANAGSRAVTFTLGTAFGVVGVQRGLVPIHGVCVASGDTAAIITGYSGSGKSAVLSVLARKGYRYLADDVVMVSVENGKPYAIPAYPQRKLAADTALATGENTSGAVSIIEDGRSKFAIRKQDEWLDKKLPLAVIVELYVNREAVARDVSVAEAKRRDVEAPGIEAGEIKGHAALALVIRNQYRRRFAEIIDETLHRIKRIVDITSSVRTFCVKRPASGASVSDTASAVEGIIKLVNP